MEMLHDEMITEASLKYMISARHREVDVKKSGAVNMTQNVLAYLAITAFFIMTGYILAFGIGELDAEESFIIGNLTGMSAAIAKDIYSYYFGSSKGEHEALRRPRLKNS